ncbi:hypothetical protein BEP19_07475 [Ammoniphilus oxalaticus]|uniref:Motility protein n=1 Tax=Ammoniphilus oxalaticus TaxID=66863 RepID=A0A419SJX0_9BACL|nr:hypothetical protein [Ammoniphilus oxalaticus]RKD24236.1 hypothetical protein BEP19_07475 [Ammoniphilus oxalaticus]
MKVSDLAAVQLTDMKQTLSMNLLKSAHATASAQAITMLEDFQQLQREVGQRTINPSPHPYSGQHVDLRA